MALEEVPTAESQTGPAIAHRVQRFLKASGDARAAAIAGAMASWLRLTTIRRMALAEIMRGHGYPMTHAVHVMGTVQVDHPSIGHGIHIVCRDDLDFLKTVLVAYHEGLHVVCDYGELRTYWRTIEFAKKQGLIDHLSPSELEIMRMMDTAKSRKSALEKVGNHLGHVYSRRDIFHRG